MTVIRKIMTSKDGQKPRIGAKNKYNKWNTVPENLDESGYLIHRLNNQINWYSNNATKNKNWHQGFQAAQLILATCITLSSVVTITGWDPYLKYIVAGLGAMIGILNGLSSLYKFQENWLSYRNTSESLIHERFRFSTGTEPYRPPSDRFNLLVDNVEALISNEHTGWVKSQNQNGSGSE